MMPLEVHHREHGDSLAALQRKRIAWCGLISKVAVVFWDKPLWRLQRVGDEVLDFLYEKPQRG